jgi:tetratricopeptide (TPR) repeat protein
MSRVHLRHVLLLAGLVPLVLALALTVLVARMALLQHRADTAYAEQRYADAAGSYRGAGRFTPFENWVAAFDAGAARHAGGDYAKAVEDYRSALALGVPHRDECTVRINLSLADEAIGDAAAKAKKYDDADQAYLAGIAALEDGGCPSDSGRGAQQSKDARTVDQRLHRKLQRDAQEKKKQQEQQKKDQQKPGTKKGKTPAQQKQEQEQKKREQQLQKQDQEGAQQREQDQDQTQGFGNIPTW